MDWFAILPTLFTVVTALFAAYIAWLQYCVSKAQREDGLYGRRIRVYHATTELLSDVVRHGYGTDKAIERFHVEISAARFHFGNDVRQFIDSVRDDALKLAELRESLDEEHGLPVGDERTAAAAEKSQVFKRVRSEYWPQVDERFRPYLECR